MEAQGAVMTGKAAITISLIILAAASSSITALAHPGGLDAQGCHTNRRTHASRCRAARGSSTEPTHPGIEGAQNKNDLLKICVEYAAEQIIRLEAAEVPVTCKRLYEVSRVLRVPMLWFFMGAPGIDLTLDLNQSALPIESPDQS
jgi:hypothetical protein